VIKVKVSTKWGRLALVAVVLVLGVALAAPGVALAKAKAATRIVVVKSVVTDWSHVGVPPVSPVVSVKLQKKSGSKWVALKGAIKAYYQSPISSSLVYQGSRTATTLNATLSSRGKYKFVFSGSSSTKSSYAYCSRLDAVGETVSNITATFDVIDATWTRVNVSYDVSWNTDAFPITGANGIIYDRPIELAYWGAFQGYDSNTDEDLYSGNVYFYQEIWEPGTVQFSYRVRTADIPPNATLETEGSINSDNDYIKTSAYQDDSTDYTVN
jgi:hypothetical protein